MPTVIDELVMTLGLDAAQYKRGQAEASASIKRTLQEADSAAKAMEAAGGRGAEFFTRIKAEALSLIGILAGSAGLGLIVRNLTDDMASLNRQAANLMLNPRELAAWQNVMERNGASAQSLTDTLTHLQSVIQDIRTFGGGSQFYGFLGPIGGTGADTPLQILEKFMRFMETHPDQVALQNQIAAGLGISPDLVQALRQMGSQAELMRELRAEADRVPTRQMTEDAIKLQKAWEDLAHQTKFLGDTITDDLAKPLAHVLEAITALEKNHPDIVIGIAMSTGAATTLAALAGLAIMMGQPEVAALLGAGALAIGLAGPSAAAIQLLLPKLSGSAAGGSAGDTGGAAGAGADAGSAAGGALGEWWSKHMPSWLGGASNVPPKPGTPQYAVMEEVRKFWKSKGFTDEQVAGILAAGPGAESGFNPDIIGDNGTSYGLYQAHAEMMKAMFAKYGPHPTVAQQNEFMWEWLQAHPDILAALRAEKTAGRAATVWTVGVERPKDMWNQAVSRSDAAKGYLPLPPPPPPPQKSSSIQSDIHIGSLQVTLPGVTDARSFAMELPNALTTQMNRGMIS